MLRVKRNAGPGGVAVARRQQRQQLAERPDHVVIIGKNAARCRPVSSAVRSSLWPKNRISSSSSAA